MSDRRTKIAKIIVLLGDLMKEAEGEGSKLCITHRAIRTPLALEGECVACAAYARGFAEAERLWRADGGPLGE